MHMSFVIRQKSYEKIIHTLRRHWVTFVPTTLLFLVLLSVPVVLYFMFKTLFPGFFDGPVAAPLARLFASAYYLGLIMFFYTQFTIFYLDMWIVTNDRIVDIEQLGLFYRTVSELDLFRIQDVTTTVHGFFASLFHYGDVDIKTASVNISIIFKNVPHPDALRQELLDLADEDAKFHAQTPQ